MINKSIFEAVENSDKSSIAHEALVMAETQFITGDFEVTEDSSPGLMSFKDDDGYYRICSESGTFAEKFDNYEALEIYLTKRGLSL